MTIEAKFEEIKSIRIFIKNTFKALTEKHTEIKEQYKTYIEANKKCEYLDSFYFQIKLLDYDYDTTHKLYNYIDNRIYCDYYKLFIIIYTFFKLNFKSSICSGDHVRLLADLNNTPVAGCFDTVLSEPITVSPNLAV